MKVLIGAVSFLFLASASAIAGTTIEVSTKTEAIPDAIARQAVQEFISSCRPLTDKYWVDVVSASAVAQNEYAGYREREYGWSTHVEIAVQLKDSPSAVPSDLNAAGHKLWYFVGAGKRPGIIAQKRQSQALCGMKPDPDGKDVFKSVPSMSVLDKK